MAFGSYDTPKPVRVPTFLQYLRVCPKGVQTGTKFPIEIVWLPGKFDNVTLQTYAFRYSAGSNHPLYDEFQQYFEGVVTKNKYPRLDITIDSIKDGKISILENPKKMGFWENLGETGRKFEEF